MGRLGFVPRRRRCWAGRRMVPRGYWRDYCSRLHYWLLWLESAGTWQISNWAILPSRCGPWDSVLVIVALIAEAPRDPASVITRQLITTELASSVAGGFP